ncbi:hypothetical protein B0H17DRAFT_1203508 [Mycena rosella]|uniref:Uncharacterized protein n=1 Tax=Mycena rosella TaxID=1033263 RepID=A0AAD7GGY3_MYCRO|nr:hypothetical protein B0H17DRAFT_1203508 [Mycena rosella]
MLPVVAWRVKDWVEPLLYRVICISDTLPMDGFCHFTVDIVYRAITRKPASFFHHAIRNLFLEDPRGTRPADYIAKMHSILAVCTGISDLFADSSLAAPMLTDTLGVVPLDHLTVDVSSLFDGRMMDFSHPIFL